MPDPPRPVVRLALVGLIALVAMVNVRRTPPFYNWDVLPYVAIAKSYALDAIADVHRETYALVEARVPPNIYRGLLLDDPPYRLTLARDPELFAQVLPFYRVKPLYPFLLHVLDRAGVDPVRAGIAISRLSYFAIAVVLAWWCASRLPPVVTALCLPILMSSGFVLRLAAYFTPDALSTLVMLVATILIVEGRARAGWPTMALAVAVRPDNLVFLGLFGLWALWHRLPHRPWIVTAMALGLVVQLGESRLAAGYGWKLLFHNAMVKRLLRPADFQPTLDLAGYVDIYVLQLRPDVLSVMLPTAMALAIAGAVIYRRWSEPRAPWTGVLTVMPVYLLIHWLVHPVDKERTLGFAYLIVLCGMLFLSARAAPTESTG